MRELIAQLLRMGYQVVFSAEAGGGTRISVFYSMRDPLSMEKPVISCTLTAGTFPELAEEVMSEFVATLQKRH